MSGRATETADLWSLTGSTIRHWPLLAALLKDWFICDCNTCAVLVRSKAFCRRADPKLALKKQLFQFDRKLYDQVDGAAMRFQLEPLSYSKRFQPFIEGKFQRGGMISEFYRRYANETCHHITILRDTSGNSE